MYYQLIFTYTQNNRSVTHRHIHVNILIGIGVAENVQYHSRSFITWSTFCTRSGNNSFNYQGKATHVDIKSFPINLIISLASHITSHFNLTIVEAALTPTMDYDLDWMTMSWFLLFIIFRTRNIFRYQHFEHWVRTFRGFAGLNWVPLVRPIFTPGILRSSFVAWNAFQFSILLHIKYTRYIQGVPKKVHNRIFGG